MTITRSNLQAESTTSATTISYQVAMPQPESHLFEVTLRLSNWPSPVLDLKMPVWTPGSYLVREYSRQVQNFSAVVEGKNLVLPSCKVGKNHYSIQTENNSDLTIHYQVFANELTVRTNHLDSTHGYFNGAALFFFIPGLELEPITVKIIPPHPDWQVTTILPLVAGETNTFIAKDFDTLVDSPFEIGCHRVYNFEVLGKPHQLAIWGNGNEKPEKMIEDMQKIIKVQADLYGGLPYDKYLFLLHLTSNSFGGLEHKDCCSLIYSRYGFRNREKYNNFMQLVAHEFFHLWNVKRIRPKALEKFNYEEENYTPSLWFSEGTTSYYDLRIPLKAGIYEAKTFVELLSKNITRYLNTPGRKVQSASESSFDAWIKLYRRDANSDNSQISYYLKGELISLLLDLLIRNRHNNGRSLDDVMRQMWDNFGRQEIGFTPSQLKEVVESQAQMDLSDFFARYIDGVEELPFNQYFEPFGLKLKTITEEDSAPHLGVRVQSENGKAIAKFVEAGSPAQKAGIDTEDELVAIEGKRVSAEQLNERLKDYQAGDIISVTVFHLDELRTLNVKLGTPQPSRYEVAQIQYPSNAQKQNLARYFE